MDGRQSTGFADGARENTDKQEAELLRDTVIALTEEGGNPDEARRLRLAGSDGYPTEDNLPVFAKVFVGASSFGRCTYPKCRRP